uniref:hypothetical protein n=1 Tax=Wolbachia TaxID=953 RepID=UPI003978616E
MICSDYCKKSYNLTRMAVIPVWNPEKRMMSSQCPCNVIPVLDTGIQPLLCSHLVKIKSSGSK